MADLSPDAGSRDTPAALSPPGHLAASSLDVSAGPTAGATGRPALLRRRAVGPWAMALRKLRQDKVAMAALLGLALVVMACVLAPAYAALAGVDPFASNPDGSIVLDGQTVPVLQPETEGLGLGLTPIGPTWRLQYFLGADSQGRDVMARLLYGGRASLLIAGAAMLMCLALAALIGIVAGFSGGLVDAVLSRLLDLLWAFPVILLAISLSIILINESIHLGPVTIDSSSLLIPMFIIGLVYIPYVGRPIRGQVLSLANSDFVLAARALGVPSGRILLRDILPNVTTTLIVFAPIVMALNMLVESLLSFLSVGVQPPNASWGTIILDGQGLLYTRPLVAIAPGIGIVLTVLALNVLGDGLRDALDPRAKLRVKGAGR